VGTRPGEPGFDPNKGFNQILYPGGQLPPGWQPNTGGMNPNLPPRDLETGGYNNPSQGHIIDGPSPFPMMPYPGGNRGSGQPINQPLSPLLGGPIQDNGAALGQATDQGPYGQKTPQQIQQYLQQGGYQGMGSLQSLGGGQLNQSGMVTLRAPDGSQTKAVPADQVAHWLSRGAVRV
jgi:hypothetical protein